MATNEYLSLSEKQIAAYKEVGMSAKQIAKLDAKQTKQLQETLSKRFDTKIDIKTRGYKKVLNLVLLGKTGTGKSATGNLIIGRDSFVTSHGSESFTAKIQKEISMINIQSGEVASAGNDSVQVNVIDTPGFSDTDKDPEVIFTEITKVVEEFSEGVDGFIFVFNMGNPRYTIDQRVAFDIMEQGFFGEGAIEHCYIILTHIETKKDISSVSQYMKEEAATPFGILLKKLAERVIAVNNHEESRYGRQVQRKNIVQMIAQNKTVTRYSEGAFEQYQQDKDDAVTRLEMDLESMAPDIDMLLSDKLRPLSSRDIEYMADHQQQQFVDEVLGIVMCKYRMSENARDKVTEAIENALHGKKARLTEPGWVKKAAVTAVQVAVAGGTGIAALSAFPLCKEIVFGGEYLIKRLARLRKTYTDK